MDVRAAGGEPADEGGRKLAVGARRHQQFRAVGKELRRAALVGLHMGRGRADDAMVGLAQGGQRQGVRGGTVEGEEHLRIRLVEQVAERVRCPLRPGILAIGGHRTAIGRFGGGPGLGADAGVIVAGELLGFGLHRRFAFRRSRRKAEATRGETRFVAVRPHPLQSMRAPPCSDQQVGVGRRRDS